MSDSPQVSSKVCLACGQDCSARPRVRDKQGRYMCKACADARARDAAQAPPSGPATADFLALEPTDLAPASPAPAFKVCPECGSSLPFGASLCVQCGFDAAKGRLVETQESRERTRNVVAARPGATKCPKCGYSLKGLKQPRCPECGSVFVRESDRDRRSRESAEIRRREYIKPVVMFVVGVAGVALYYTAMKSPEAIPAYVIALLAEVAVALVIYLACAFLWIGFDAPIHLQAMRLMGVYAVAALIGAVASMLPFPILSTAITIVCFVGMLSELLDLDLNDAIIVAILTVLARMVIMFTLLAPMLGHGR